MGHTALTTPPEPDRRLCIAPMLDWTDKHQRYLMRLITPQALLYTEMITANALYHGDRDYLLSFNNEEHPVALQLGGSDPALLAQSARWAQQYGYDEVNLNIGCPSNRVQKGSFGACLMAEPELVRDCIKAMQDAAELPVTVKCRIGIDQRQEFQQLMDFIGTVADSGCSTFIVHARIAVLSGLSPKQNREVPPLKYDWVYQIKQQLPHLQIIINGGIKTVGECQQHLEYVDGVMIGREAYQNPYAMLQCSQSIYQTSNNSSREQILHQYMEYCQNQMEAGVKLKHLSRHCLGLFQGQRGAKKFRRVIAENAHLENANVQVLEQALLAVQ